MNYYEDFRLGVYDISPKNLTVKNTVTGRNLLVNKFKNKNIYFLSLKVEGKTKNFIFSRLVFCFHNNIDYNNKEIVVLTKDGNPLNTQKDNFFIAKRSEVIYSRIRKDLSPLDKLLSDESIVEIFKERKTKFMAKIAEDHKVCMAIVRRIHNLELNYGKVVRENLSEVEIQEILKRKNAYSNGYVGNNFGKWRVVEYLGIDIERNNIFSCCCECGEKSILYAKSLNIAEACNGGCRKCNNKRREQPIYKHYYNLIRRSAEKRKIPFSVSFEDIINKMVKQNYLCAYTKEPIDFVLGRKNKSNSTASLDRIDSSLGYTKDNIQWVHKRVNIMKGNMKESEFLDFCNKISKNN